MANPLNKSISSGHPVVILGGRGMLAGAMADALDYSGVGYVRLARQDLDITDKNQVHAVLGEIRPGVIINCAGHTNVDGAESEPERAFAVNATGPGNVAETAARLGALMVHVSTDYVFDGRKSGAYLPGDEPNPLGVYGKSKLEGEKNVRQAGPEHLIVRTSWLFGPGGKNFVATMLEFGRTRSRLDVVDDQRGSPTYTRHLARGILGLLDHDLRGIFHLTNSGTCTWFEFAKEIFRQAGMKVEVNPVPTEAFPRPAPRPRNSVLDCSSTFEVLGGPLPSWQDALNEYLGELRKKEEGRGKRE